MNDIAQMLDALNRDRLASPRAAQLIAAAAKGDGALEDCLDGVVADADPPDLNVEVPLQGPFFLRSLDVRGFRGIGPAVSLDFAPAPGLHVIFGANGTGKSSLIEALELAMTGKVRRLEGRTLVWRQAVGNLHQGPASIAVDFEASSSCGPRSTVTIKATSTRDPMKDLDIEFVADSQPARQAWARAAVTHRPLLTGEELQRAFAGRPADLHDSIFQILGLGELLPTRDRLVAARKQRDSALKACEVDRQGLLQGALSADAPWSRRLAFLLDDPAPDPGELASLLGESDSISGVDRALLEIDFPSSAEVEAVLERLAAAQREAALAQVQLAESAEGALAPLLAAAVDHLESTGTDTCPVCGETRLDEAWQRQTRARLREFSDTQARALAATLELDQQRSAAMRLIQRGPSITPSLDPATRKLLETWRAPLSGGADTDLAAHLQRNHGPLRTALNGQSARAKADLERQTGDSEVLRLRMRTWLEEYRALGSAATELRALKAAERWINSYIASQRDSILIPYTRECHAIWTELGQGSDVVLGNVELKGTTSVRKLVLNVSLGAAQADAQSVMSQGELLSLALSLFIPRATSAASPFGFVVLDDPVQALDTSRVQGLARVLGRAAKSRQVIVSTQDERLLQALQATGSPMTVLDVYRGPGSRVAVSDSERR